ncbi:hypothetical protein HGRIS_007659 [Hohenbuehelia grisea]|uniref:Major facilitator superfamily (MFS) profile domain-containing protein n=1 Tax=Hohenbuehelia grisea TaxID=104357 RepID=A0ABR3J5H5_9AGAR
MSINSEESPLLPLDPHEQVYKRFSPWQKRVILAQVSLSGLLPLFTSGTFVPAIPKISKDLSVSPAAVSLAVSISICGAAVGSLVFATYSRYYGRRPVYLFGLPFFCIGSYCISTATDVRLLLVYRFFQAFGVSSGMSVGGAVIGDVFKLEERGRAMGIFLAMSLLGPAIAPFVGGAFTRYASWRALQAFLCGCGILLLLVMYRWFPETSHPGTRGVDKELPETEQRRFKFVWLNPLSGLYLLRGPTLTLVMLTSYTILLTDYVLLIPLAYTFGPRYNITNEALIGACFIPAGLGNMIGAPLAGYLSDVGVVKWRAKRGGVWYPEDRLRTTLFGAAVCVPGSILVVGLTLKFVPGTIGLVICLVSLFVNGIGVDLVLSPSSAYLVDVMHSRSAETMAACQGSRALILAASVSLIIPSINTLGVLATNTISALLAWVGFGMIWACIKYGDRMRAWIDVGYSTADNN